MSGSSDWMFSLVLVVLAVGFVGGFFYNQGRPVDYSSKSLSGGGSLGGGTSGIGGSLGGTQNCCRVSNVCVWTDAGCGGSPCESSECGPNPSTDPNCFPIDCPGGKSGMVCFDRFNIPKTYCPPITEGD